MHFLSRNSLILQNSKRKIFSLVFAFFFQANAQQVAPNDIPYFSNLTIEDAKETKNIKFASELNGIGPHLIEIQNNALFGSDVTLRAHYFKADNPKALVLGAHGMQSNARWFMRTGTYLAQNGISVLVYDRRGSGLSDGNRPLLQRIFGSIGKADPNPQATREAAPGLRGHVNTGIIFRRLTQNASREFLSDIEKSYKKLVALNKNYSKGNGEDLDVYVLANCFGSRIAFPFVNSNSKKIKGLFVTAPATDMHPRANVNNLVAKADVALPLFHFLSAKDYLATPLKDTYFVSKDNPAYSGIEDDNVSLSLRFGTGDFFWATSRLQKKIMKAVSEMKTPLMIALGNNDQMVINQNIVRRFRDGVIDTVIDKSFRADPSKKYKGPGKILTFKSEHMLEFTAAGYSFDKAMIRWIEADQKGENPLQIQTSDLNSLISVQDLNAQQNSNIEEVKKKKRFWLF